MPNMPTRFDVAKAKTNVTCVSHDLQYSVVICLTTFIHFINDLMNHPKWSFWNQLLNNWFVNNIVLYLEMLNRFLIRYENTIIKLYTYAYKCIYKLFTNVY